MRYEGEDLGIKVSTICPGHVQTDIYKNMEVANIANEKVVASLPVKAMDTKEAARVILDGVVKNKDIIIFPANVRWAWRINRFSPDYWIRPGWKRLEICAGCVRKHRLKAGGLKQH